MIIPFIIVFSLVLLYAGLHFLVFDQDPLTHFLNRFTESWLYFQEGMANRILRRAGSGVFVEDHRVIFQGSGYEEIRSGTLMRKWIALLVLIAWVCPAPLQKKIRFSLLVVGLNFVVTPFTIAFQAYLSSMGSDLYSHTRISRTPAHLMNMTLLFVWLSDHRESLWKFLARLRIDPEEIRRRSTAIVLVSYVCLILGYFILGCFEFTPWVNFLFHSTQRILSWFQIESLLESHVLIGENGSLSMLKSCLGLNTMLLFASLVFIMGGNNLAGWIYMVCGLVILNMANILRLVLLFMHLQKHGTYVGRIDYHDLYDYIIYGIVFLLWVVWFEWFSTVRLLDRNR